MQASGEPIPLTDHRLQQFGQDIIAAVQQQMTEGTVIQPSVYFLPGTDMPDFSCAQDRVVPTGSSCLHAAYTCNAVACNCMPAA